VVCLLASVLQKDAMNTQEIIGMLEVDLHGLCTNCANIAHCSYRKRTNKTIIQCELYELKNHVSTVKGFSNGKNKQAIEFEKSNQLVGLCMNCDKANFCQLPERKTGVWHCEEYR
jgi:hypothetical protein